MSDEGSEEKTDPPSERKLAKLREDGMLPSSETGTNFFAFAASSSP